MKLIKRLFKKIYSGRDGHSDHGSSPVPPHPVEQWFQLDVTPLDSGYQLIR